MKITRKMRILQNKARLHAPLSTYIIKGWEGKWNGEEYVEIPGTRYEFKTT